MMLGARSVRATTLNHSRQCSSAIVARDGDDEPGSAVGELLCEERQAKGPMEIEAAKQAAQGKIRVSAPGDGRTHAEADHDRILFSTPVRRLADKTQVFPLERNDSVRNRLTHSLASLFINWMNA